MIAVFLADMNNLMNNFRTEVQDYTGQGDTCIILAGTKDIEGRVVIINVPPLREPCRLWLRLPGSCRSDARQCKRRTSPTSGASER